MITAGAAGQIQILTINGAVKKQQERNHPCSGNSRHLDDDYRKYDGISIYRLLRSIIGYHYQTSKFLVSNDGSCVIQIGSSLDIASSICLSDTFA